MKAFAICLVLLAASFSANAERTLGFEGLPSFVYEKVVMGPSPEDLAVFKAECKEKIEKNIKVMSGIGFKVVDQEVCRILIGNTPKEGVYDGVRGAVIFAKWN